VKEPFRSLAGDYPGHESYPAKDFRVEWGPIFHRGRLDGSAKVLIIGQDPGQHESIARRILVGEAGQRTQGFLAKLGIERSYVMVNAFLYSVYGQQGGERHKDDPAIANYRNRWLDALLDGSEVAAVISFGQLGRHVFYRCLHTPRVPQRIFSFDPLIHPTMPEASSKGNKAKKATATKKMLTQWNAALDRLDRNLGERDADRALIPYGQALLPDDRAAIPAADLPAGSPPWMSSVKQWATRKALTTSSDRKVKEESKRATVVVTVPKGERPWN